jgi:hypothetical protein
MDVEEINDNEMNIALIIRHTFFTNGIKFFTPDSYSQQIGYMNRPSGYVIKPHIHNPVPREVQYTNEVLFIRSGQVRVNFYSENQKYLCSRDLYTGDIILLIRGGHGFEMLEATEIIEVKQGPYSGDLDKKHFSPAKIF